MQTELDNGRHYTLALRPGTLLNGVYRITRVLRQSSTFAITYLAQNEHEADQVVIKELLPRTLAGRGPDELTVLPHSADDESSLSRTQRRFKREAELLADIAHPNIPRVRRYFEDNGTAYLVFQHYEGRTLAEHAAAAGGRLPVDQAAGLVLQLLQGLEALHAEGIIHGYVTPDSVLVDANSRALILGLGTTRHVVGSGKEPAAGFAPIEQYAAREVGPWTDVYACAAVFYRLATGLTPPSAVERSAGQSMPLSWVAAANVPPAIVRTVTTALAQLPDTRPHSAEEFRRRLDGSLALGVQVMGARDQRVTNTRWPPTDSAEPVMADAPAEPAIVAESPPFDDDAFVATAERPSDRVRRLLRLVLGISGAAAGILLAVSVLGGRGEDEWSGAGIVAAAPASIAKARPSPAGSDAPLVEQYPAPPALGDPSPSRDRAPEPSLRQASAGPPRTAEKQEETPPRPRPSVGRTGAQGGRLPTVERASATPVAGPPAIALTLPPTLGQFELLPSEVLAGLRERMAHGKENIDYGEYAGARRIYRAALDQIASLGDRYAGTQSLLFMKKELEEAAERALVACAAENEVIRRRNGKAVQCD